MDYLLKQEKHELLNAEDKTKLIQKHKRFPKLRMIEYEVL